MAEDAVILREQNEKRDSHLAKVAADAARRAVDGGSKSDQKKSNGNGNSDAPPAGDPPPPMRAVGACVGYMMRELSRQRVPDFELVHEVLCGLKEVPECGYINCLIDYEHVH